MFTKKLTKRIILSVLAATSCLVGVGVPTLVKADGGVTLFSGIERPDILSYHLDFGGQPNNFDRYKLRIASKKVKKPIKTLIIKYPDYYNGKFDDREGKMEIRANGESLPLKSMQWDKENYQIRFELEEAVPADTGLEAVLHNVRNPFFGGTYYFHAGALAPDDVPLPLYLGSWIISIDR
ncbi:MAG: DUF2808 domain-containing protein [Spirulinaceae cyanobacterium]